MRISDWSSDVCSSDLEPVAFFLLRARSASDHALFTEITGVGDRIAKGLLSGDYRTALEQFVDYWSGAGTWKAMAPEAQDTLCRRIPAVALQFATTTGERTPPRAAEPRQDERRVGKEGANTCRD